MKNWLNKKKNFLNYISTKTIFFAILSVAIIIFLLPNKLAAQTKDGIIKGTQSSEIGKKTNAEIAKEFEEDLWVHLEPEFDDMVAEARKKLDERS